MSVSEPFAKALSSLDVMVVHARSIMNLARDDEAAVTFVAQSFHYMKDFDTDQWQALAALAIVELARTRPDLRGRE